MMNSCVLRPNAKKCRVYMQEGGQKVDVTGSTRFHNTLWKKSAWIAPPNTLTDSYIRFLSTAQPYFILMTQSPKSKPYFITLPKCTLLIQSGMSTLL